MYKVGFPVQCCRHYLFSLVHVHAFYAIVFALYQHKPLIDPAFNYELTHEVFCSKNRFKRAENKHKMFLLGEAQLFKFPLREKNTWTFLCQSKHEFQELKNLLCFQLSTQKFGYIKLNGFILLRENDAYLLSSNSKEFCKIIIQLIKSMNCPPFKITSLHVLAISQCTSCLFEKQTSPAACTNVAIKR